MLKMFLRKRSAGGYGGMFDGLTGHTVLLALSVSLNFERHCILQYYLGSHFFSCSGDSNEGQDSLIC